MFMAAVKNSTLTLKAKLFRGLADPSRLAIIESLRSGEKIVSELVTATALSQPNVSGHLTCLKDCGLVTSRQEGRCVFYALSDPNMEALITAAESILARLAEQITGCSNYKCQSEKKCVRNKDCNSSVRVSPSASNKRMSNISLAEGS
jgi:ArsR family transcriptional regulator, cadmium/lead-responsive transcriptional repressor